MKYKVLLIVTAFTLLATPLVFGDADIQNLILSRQGNQTVLRIDAGDAVTFKHFSVDAKDGKPFRIIVDMQQAVHRLPVKDFANLPSSAVNSIRTSQFSTDPDRVVRVVLDMNETAPYEVKNEGTYVYIYIKAANDSDFLTWNSSNFKKSAPVKTEKATAAKPAENKKADPAPLVSPFKKDIIDKKPVYADDAETEESDDYSYSGSMSTSDDQSEQPISGNSGLSPVLAMNGDSEPVIPETESEPVPEYQPAFDWSAWQYVRPQQSGYLEKDIAMTFAWQLQQQQQQMAQYTEETETVIAEEPITEEPITEEPVVEEQFNTEEMAQEPAPEPEPIVYQESPVNQTSVPVMPQPIDTNPQQSSPEFDKPYVRPQVVQTTPPNVPPEPQLAVNTPVDTLLEETPSSQDTTTLAQEDAQDEKPTSRFRRQPVFPAKLKGTIVAEFPTRMVIKYAPGVGRDPFETLIDETKRSDNPIERKIPDVETARLVGVLQSTNGERRALLEDLDGYGYILKSGDKVKKGYVGKIDEDRAYFRLFEYGWSRTVALYLSQN